MSKLDMFANLNKGLTSDDFQTGAPNEAEMYHAMYAYETYGDATRDNTFQDLVALGEDLESNGGAE